MSVPFPSAAEPQPGVPVLHTTLNRLSVVALVAAVVLPLVGIVLGHLALRQIDQTGERGRVLAVAATALAYLLSLGALIGIVAYFATLTGMLAT
jgi:uncharacterized membrane protein